METNMARTASGMALPGIHAGDGWRLLRNLLGGLVIVAIWLSLWTWVTVGVVRPLSHVTGAAAGPAAGTEQRI
jgi:hypothetical protein